MFYHWHIRKTVSESCPHTDARNLILQFLKTPLSLFDTNFSADFFPDFKYGHLCLLDGDTGPIINVTGQQWLVFSSKAHYPIICIYRGLPYSAFCVLYLLFCYLHFFFLECILFLKHILFTCAYNSSFDEVSNYINFYDGKMIEMLKLCFCKRWNNCIIWVRIGHL